MPAARARRPSGSPPRARRRHPHCLNAGPPGGRWARVTIRCAAKGRPRRRGLFGSAHDGGRLDLPRRPPRGGRPAVAPPVLQPPGLPARAAAERRRRHHRPRRGGTRRTATGSGGAGRRLPRRLPARRGHRHRPRRGRHPRGARDDRRVDQARRARPGPRELPGAVRHRPALLLPGHRRDPGDHPPGRQRRDLALGRPRRRHVCRVARPAAARRARAPTSPSGPAAARPTCCPPRSWSGWPRRSRPTCGSTSSSRRRSARCPWPGGPSRGRRARARPDAPPRPAGARACSASPRSTSSTSPTPRRACGDWPSCSPTPRRHEARTGSTRSGCWSATRCPTCCPSGRSSCGPCSTPTGSGSRPRASRCTTTRPCTRPGRGSASSSSAGCCGWRAPTGPAPTTSSGCTTSPPRPPPPPTTTCSTSWPSCCPGRRPSAR